MLYLMWRKQTAGLVITESLREGEREGDLRHVAETLSGKDKQIKLKKKMMTE